MKIICCLFSVLILLMSVMPCSDELLHSNDATSTMIDQQHARHPSDAGADLCSPFCQCTCCASPVVAQNAGTTVPAPSSGHNTYPVCLTGKAIHGYRTVWQPPRIA